MEQLQQTPVQPASGMAHAVPSHLSTASHLAPATPLACLKLGTVVCGEGGARAAVHDHCTKQHRQQKATVISCWEWQKQASPPKGGTSKQAHPRQQGDRIPMSQGVAVRLTAASWAAAHSYCGEPGA